jgi:hypothetical protein
MSKRNFTLLIIALVIIAIVAFMFFSSSKSPSVPTGEGGGTNFFAKFNPFNRNKTTPPAEVPPTDISGGELPPPEEIMPPVKLRKVSTMPIAGYGVFMKERFKAPTLEEVGTPTDNLEKKVKPAPPLTEFMPALRYVARATGNIYQTFADKINEQKFSSTTIPKVYEAYFGNNGEKVVMRYLKAYGITIDTFAGTLPKEILGGDSMGINELKGSFLPENITDVSISPDFLKIFYLFTTNDTSVGITSDVTGEKKSQVFSSPFTEWLAQWPNTNMITLTTKPSSAIPGYMYALNPTKKPTRLDGDINKILGGINGLTTLTSPDGKYVLYGDNNLSLSVYNINTKNSATLGVQTLPEKCVWGKLSDVVYCAVPKSTEDALYPDDWYQGEISFSDEIWQIDVVTNNTFALIDPVSVVGREDIDGIKLALDKDENYLFFVNKKDSFLWELELK